MLPSKLHKYFHFCHGIRILFINIKVSIKENLCLHHIKTNNQRTSLIYGYIIKCLNTHKNYISEGFSSEEEIPPR